MKITVNDKAYTVDDDLTVEALLPVIGIVSDGIAIAVDGTVVPRPDWSSVKLAAGSSVVIIKAFYGG